jgi:thiol-disulfide isomerase/thioredoxin
MTTQTQTKLQTTLWPWLLLIALALLLGGGWLILNQTKPDTNRGALEPAPVKGHPSPEISLMSTDGTLVNLSDFKGKPVIINFWATWCPPCRAETPDLQEVHRELGDKVAILSVNATSQDGGDVAGFMREFGVTFTVVLDPEGKAFEAYNIRGLPTTIFVDRAGIVNEVFTGAVNKAYIESKLSEL